MRFILKMLSNETFATNIFKFGLKKSFKTHKSYEYQEVVEALNTLQTNATVLQNLRKTVGIDVIQKQNIQDTVKYLKRVGITVEDVENNLSVIHVSGTKGKGSTCAYCESILRSHGYKTGFFSSPHLIAVRERIRINGQPISESDFIKYFWNVYNKLLAKQENKNDMPPYFKFLTVMALKIFMAEKVDVAIIEVGIGGEYDCTNILNKVPVVGITSLGLDHTFLLGNTVDKIAWQKGGIIKNGSFAFTSAEQPVAALKVLQQRAKEKNCELFVAPCLEEYNWRGREINLGLQGDVQKLNASLALQMTNAWMLTKSMKENKNAMKEEIRRASKGFTVNNASYYGLKECKWPGRNQIIERISSKYPHTYFLDGAHTVESIQQCVEWFVRTSESKSLNCHRTLVFNATGDREDSFLMKPLLCCNFQSVLFCPNISTVNMGSSDQINYSVNLEQVINRCKNNVKLWKKVEENEGKYRASHVAMYPTTLDALIYTESIQSAQHILVTGSIHLIGAALSILDPDLISSFDNKLKTKGPKRIS
uniref:Folylpolyglutamate synthase n=1 Tax=Clastoptera arizonana TaxID=38151 RepID=A0A1B6DJU4_9HEMI